MKHKRMLTFYALEAAVCAAMAIQQWFDGSRLPSLLAFPFEPLGRLLRALSLSSRGGDFLAWALCMILSSTPLLLLLCRRNDRRWMDALLPLASLLTFAALYLAVNPSLQLRYLGEAGALMGTAFLGGAVYSVLLTWGLLRLLRQLEEEEPWSLIKAILWILGAVFVYAAFGRCPAALLEEINTLRSGNTAPGQNLGATILMLSLGCLMEAGFWLLDLWVLFAAMELLEQWRLNCGEAMVTAAGELYRRGSITLKSSLLLSLALDLLQLLFARSLLRVHTTLRLPLFSVAFLLLMLLISRLMRENKDLRDDNDLFI